MDDKPVLGLRQSAKAVALTTDKRIAALEKEVAELKKFRKTIETMLSKGAK